MGRVEEGHLWRQTCVYKSKSHAWILLGKNGRIMDYGMKAKEWVLGYVSLTLSQIYFEVVTI